MLLQSVSQKIYSKLRIFLSFIKWIALIGLPLCLLKTYHPHAFYTLIQQVDRHAENLRIVRWSIIVLFISLWPWVIEFIGKKLTASREKIIYWKQQWLRIAMWIILFELLICENIIIKLIKWI
ncbi:MAG: hypothetical protein ABI597_07640 [Gammaproteobacteria bacterium]